MSIIQVKNVPLAMHGELRRRAGQEGLTIRDYVLKLIERDAEVLHAVTRYVRRGEMSDERARQALGLLVDADIERFPIAPLVLDAWRLRHNVSSYDAFYVALARELGSPLITCDRALAGAPGLGISVTVIGS